MGRRFESCRKRISTEQIRVDLKFKSNLNFTEIKDTGHNLLILFNDLDSKRRNS